MCPGSLPGQDRERLRSPIHGSIGNRGSARFVFMVNESALPHPTPVIPVFSAFQGFEPGFEFRAKDNKNNDAASE